MVQRFGAVVGEHDGLLGVGGADAGLPDEGRQAEHHAGLEPLGGRGLGQRMGHERQVEAEAQPAGDRHGRCGDAGRGVGVEQIARRRARHARRQQPFEQLVAAPEQRQRVLGARFADDDGPAQLAEVAVADHAGVERDEVTVRHRRVAARTAATAARAR